MNITVYIADRKKNQMMAAFDLCPPYKVFVSMIHYELERQGVDSTNEEFAKRLISSSRRHDDYWIPAVCCDGVLYAADEIREISDGNCSLFIPKG